MVEFGVRCVQIFTDAVRKTATIRTSGADLPNRPFSLKSLGAKFAKQVAILACEPPEIPGADACCRTNGEFIRFAFEEQLPGPRRPIRGRWRGIPLFHHASRFRFNAVRGDQSFDY